MKVIFDYNEATGFITGKNGMTVYMMGMLPFESEPQSSKVDDLVKLKAAGFTAEEIVLLNHSGI